MKQRLREEDFFQDNYDLMVKYCFHANMYPLWENYKENFETNEYEICNSKLPWEFKCLQNEQVMIEGNKDKDMTGYNTYFTIFH
jgi:hypothetical protein